MIIERKVSGLYKGYIVCLILSIVAFVMTIVTGVSSMIMTGDSTTIDGYSMVVTGAMLTVLFLCLAFLLLMSASIISFILLYRFWAVIRDGEKTRVKPGTAVGFLFIPFYNLYWTFIAYVGLSVDMKHYIEEKGMDNHIAAPSKGLAIALSILNVLSIVGFLFGGFILPILIANFVITIIFLLQCVHATEGLNAVHVREFNESMADFKKKEAKPPKDACDLEATNNEEAYEKNGTNSEETYFEIKN